MKRILSLVVVICILSELLTAMPAFADTIASGTCGDNLTWTLDDEGTLTISGTGEMTNWWNFGSKPASWDSYRSSIRNIVINDGVTSIGYAAFYSCTSLTSISIPNSVTSIENYAFYICFNLTDVYYGGSGAEWKELNIGTYNDCLTYVTIHFTYSDNLTWTLNGNGTLTISSSGTMTNWDYYDNAPWYSNSSSIKNVVINDGVTSIGDWAFYDCGNLTNINIPNSLTSIGDNAFHYCESLINISIPNSVTNIGDSAFYGCVNLTDVFYEGSETEWKEINIGKDNLYLTDAVIHYNIINSGAFGDNFMWGLDDGGTLTISGSGAMTDWKYYEDAPWYSINSSIKNVVINDGVTSIGNWMFSQCDILTNISIPNGVTSIGDCAFYDCDSLTSISIPDSVTRVRFLIAAASQA